MVGSTPGGGAPGCDATLGGNVTSRDGRRWDRRGGTAFGLLQYGVLYSTIGIGNGNILRQRLGTPVFEVLNASTGGFVTERRIVVLVISRGTTAPRTVGRCSFSNNQQWSVEMYDVGDVLELRKLAHLAISQRLLRTATKIGCNSVSSGVFIQQRASEEPETNGACSTSLIFQTPEAGGDVMMNLENSRAICLCRRIE